MSQINISHLTFAYEGSWDNIFEDVSFQIDTDWRLGFIGRNGRGKTTFLNLLMGKYEYKGSISSPVPFEYFPYEVTDKTLPAIDIISRINPHFQMWELECELSMLDLEEEVLNRPFGTLSNGEQTKMLLAALFLKETSFLLIDEPTNHLDIDARRVVSDYLRSKSGFILVSHDRSFLDHCADHILSINKTNIEVQKGNFSSWWENKRRQDNFELDQNEKLKKDIKRLQAAARRTAEWADKAEGTKIGFDPAVTDNSKGRRAYIGEKSRKMMKRSKNIGQRQQSAIEEKSQLLKNIDRTDSLKITSLAYHKQRLLELNDVSVFYSQKQACRGVSFFIEQGERIALQGKNGSGKTSLIKLICGDPLDYIGNLHIGSRLAVSCVTQDTSYLKGNLWDFAAENHIDQSLFMSILRKLDFSRAQFEKDVGDYSEGQKKKVLIAKSLCENAHLYIWDEPLNFIDVFSRMQIEELLMEFKPTILFVEHDLSFTEKIATKVVHLE
jgi:lincosamide and streptogramin A transport system ATP-binding/permease protein